MGAQTPVFRFDDSAERLRALAHPIRLAIVNLLYHRGGTAVGDIYQTLEVDQAMVSHHLKILRYQKIVKVERQGRHAIYSLTDAVYHDIISLVFHPAGQD